MERPRLSHSIFILILYFAVGSYAAETKVQLKELTLKPITYETVVFEQSTFLPNSPSTVVPFQKFIFESPQSNLVKTLQKETAFPVVDYGYPGGGIGVNLGGRSSEETQVSTLGVPLGLPQGGGVDFSQFPAYLFSNAKFSQSNLNTGSHPMAVSGSIQFNLLTQDALLDSSLTKEPYSFSASYDRQVQSFSIGAIYPDTSIVAGSQLGLLQGPAGSFSHRFFSNGRQHLKAHVLGSTLEAANPGSRFFPTPQSKKESFRVIPVLEYGNQFSDDASFQFTSFGDVSLLQLSDPSTQTRSEQFGFESQVQWQPKESPHYAFGVSSRYINFSQQGGFEKSETPTRLFVESTLSPNSFLELKPQIYAHYLNSEYPIQPGGKLGLKWKQWFNQWEFLPKLPSIQDRYYQIPTYSVGNPNLRPEKIYRVLFGHSFESNRLESAWSLKGEFRTDLLEFVENPPESRVINTGNGYLLGAEHRLRYLILSELELRNHALIQKSHLSSAQREFLQFPRFSNRLSALWSVTSQHQLTLRNQIQGPSRSANQNVTPTFTLFDLEWSGEWFGKSYGRFGVVIENILNHRAEFIEGYPLPGRLVGLQWSVRI